MDTLFILLGLPIAIFVMIYWFCHMMWFGEIFQNIVSFGYYRRNYSDKEIGWPFMLYFLTGGHMVWFILLGIWLFNTGVISRDDLSWFTAIWIPMTAHGAWLYHKGGLD